MGAIQTASPVLYLKAKFQHCSMRQSKVRAGNMQHVLHCDDLILDVIFEMLGNLSFTQRTLVNFFIKIYVFSLLKNYSRLIS